LGKPGGRVSRKQSCCQKGNTPKKRWSRKEDGDWERRKVKILAGGKILKWWRILEIRETAGGRCREMTRDLGC